MSIDLESEIGAVEERPRGLWNSNFAVLRSLFGIELTLGICFITAPSAR
jgi:hypothetical protein